MPNVALNVGANRILVGVGITHPLGDPSLDPAREAELRARLVGRALVLLATPVSGQQVFVAEG